MDEFEIINRYFARQGRDEAVRIGIGDDGAVLTPAHGRDLVVVVDTIIHGVHYPPNLPAADVGYRAVEVNLSDIAAMAARPRWMTLALTMSDEDPAWLEGFAQGLFASAGRFGVSLVGGDTTRGEQTVVSVQIAGDVERDKHLVRAGAKAGDLLFVTGTPGDAAAGLAILTGDVARSAAHESACEHLVRRFSRPTARVEFGAAIGDLASAAIDISDGLFGDARKLLEASGRGGRMELGTLPLSAQIRAVCDGDKAGRLALTGGDDYELCFTANPSRESDIRAAADRLGLRVTRIGDVTDGGSLTLAKDGRQIEFSDDGYRHF